MSLEAIPSDCVEELLLSVNETKDKMENHIDLLKDWMSCQPHLPNKTYDFRILHLFLRGCKHDLEKTKRKLDAYFTARSVYPELFGQRDPVSKEVQFALQYFNVIPLPKPTEDGCRVTLHKFCTSDTSKFDPRVVFRAMMMIGDIRLIEDPAIVGDVFLFDVANMGAGHLAKLMTPLLKKTLNCTQEAYPQRLKEIHLFNAPPIIDRVVGLFKQFLKEKMRNRFQIHKGYETLQQFIPKSHLPVEYGGDLKTMTEMQRDWCKKLESYQNYFQEQETVKSDETKRSGRSNKTNDDICFGYQGAFRKLNID